MTRPKLKVDNNFVMSMLPMLLMLFVFYKIYDTFFGKSEAEKKADEQQLALYNSIKAPDVTNATITPNDANNLASQIYNASSFLGDDNEDAIYTCFAKITNSDDMRMVYKAFGFRLYGLYGFRKSYDLPSFLREVLSFDEMAPLEYKLSWL